MQNKVELKSSYIPTLDGWRAIAVSLVIAAHCSPMLVRNGSRPALMLQGLVAHAGYGVDIFFALSGFLICSLLLGEKERTATISLSRFYVRRGFRILPPLLLYLSTVVTLSKLGILPHVSAQEILSVLFFFRNYFVGTWYTGHFWSLAVEEHFYLFAPIVFLLFRKKQAAWLSLCMIATCILTRRFEFTHYSFGGNLLQFRTENRFDGLLWGSLLAIVFTFDKARSVLQRVLTGWVFLGLLGGAVGLLTVFSSRPSRRTIVALVMPLLIAHTVLRTLAPIGRFLELSVFRWVGHLSYSLYLWQMLFLPEIGKNIGVLQTFPFALGMSIMCAALSFYFVEKPLIKIGHRLAASPGSLRDKRLT